MKYIKYISLLLFFLVSSSSVDAQAVNRPDVIYLNNGSVFRGTIIEYVPGGLLKLKIAENSTIIIRDDEIQRIIQVDNKKQKQERTKREYAFTERGFYNIASVHLSASEEAFGNDLVTDAGFHYILGYQFNRFLGAGLGVGYDYYYIDSGQNIMPIYAEARGYTRAKNFSPMYSLALGYGFTFDGEEGNRNFNFVESKGGIMFYPSVGFRMGGSSNANFFMDFGVKVQKATFTYQNWDLRVNKMTYNRFIFRTGVMF